MTTTKLRLAAAGIAALLGLSLTAPSAEATSPPPSSAETGELVPSHAGHDHGGDEAKADKGKKKGKGKGAKKDGKKKGKGKKGR